MDIAAADQDCCHHCLHLSQKPFPAFQAHYTEFNRPITHGDTGLALSPPLTLPSRQRDVPHGYVWSASDLATSNSSSTVSQNHLVHCSVSRSAHVFRLNFGNLFHSVTTGYQQHVTSCAIEPQYNQCVIVAPTVVTVPGRQEPSFERSKQSITNRRVLFSSFWRNSPQWARASSFTRFLDHTQRHTTVDRTLLDEWSACRRDLYLTTHNTHNTQTSMPPAGFEPRNPSKRAATDPVTRSPSPFPFDYIFISVPTSSLGADVQTFFFHLNQT